MKKYTIQNFHRLKTKFQKDENGATSIEYAIIAAGIALVIVTTFYTLGSSVSDLFTFVNTTL